MSWPADISTTNLVVAIHKLAKDASYYKPAVRALVLEEAAKRLTEYREAERTQARPVPLPGRSPDPAHRSGEQHRNGGAT